MHLKSRFRFLRRRLEHFSVSVLQCHNFITTAARSFMTQFCIFFILLVHFCTLLFASYPNCANISYLSTGFADVRTVLTTCLANVPASTVPPSYFIPKSIPTRQYNATIVNTSVAINTLIEVDDITAQVTADIYLRAYWKDDRLKLPTEFWEDMNPAVAREGLEISSFVRDAANPLPLWLPDIQIVEAVTIETLAELVHLFEDGNIFWSRHMLVTLTEAQMDLHKYPMDSQTFVMSLQSFAFSDDFVKLQPVGSDYIVFNSNPSLDSVYVDLNRLWEHKSTNAYVRSVDSGIFFDSNRRYSTITINMGFERKSYGIIFRLAFPVVIFMLIVGYTFWVDVEKRIDISVTMLLVVSALYSAIGQIIPFVGYFTIFDLYITSAFVLLSISILIHFVVYVLDSYKKKHPMLGFGSNLIEFVSRIFAVPVACMLISYYFSIVQLNMLLPLSVLVAITVGYALMTYGKNVEATFWQSFDKLHDKKHGKPLSSRTLNSGVSRKNNIRQQGLSPVRAPLGDGKESASPTTVEDLVGKLVEALQDAKSKESDENNNDDDYDEVPSLISKGEDFMVDWIAKYLAPNLRPIHTLRREESKAVFMSRKVKTGTGKPILRSIYTNKYAPTAADHINTDQQQQHQQQANHNNYNEDDDADTERGIHVHSAQVQAESNQASDNLSPPSADSFGCFPYGRGRIHTKG